VVERVRRAVRPFFQRLAINGANLAEGVRRQVVREAGRSAAVPKVLTEFPPNYRAVQHVGFNNGVGFTVTVPEEAVRIVVAPPGETIVIVEKQPEVLGEFFPFLQILVDRGFRKPLPPVRLVKHPRHFPRVLVKRVA